MVIEQIIFWTGFVVLESALLFCIVFLIWHVGVWIEKHNKYYFYALWAVLYSYWKRRGKEPGNIMYYNDRRYQIVEVVK